MTKFSLNLSFTVHYKYMEISGFTPVFIHKNSFELFFYRLIFYFENFVNVNMTFAVKVRGRAFSIPADPTILEPGTGYRKRDSKYP